MKLAHSNVRHKPPHPEFTHKFKLKVWDGRRWVHEIRIGGTQKLDGFFASFRREVGKKSFNTTGPSPETADAMESQLHERMRTFQFLYWFSFTDALQVFGEMRKLERISVGSVTWTSLKHFSKQVPAAIGDSVAPVLKSHPYDDLRPYHPAGTPTQSPEAPTSPVPAVRKKLNGLTINRQCMWELVGS